MSDLFAVDLALDLSPTVPAAVLDRLRRHLGFDVGGDERDAGDETPDFVPLLDRRGPAARIGGVLTGELVQGNGHWSLTARQEIHAELLPDLDELAEMLARNAKVGGVIGQVRFHEEDIPELLINRSGALVKLRLREADSTAS
ncbi:hypothetical protein RKE30_06205 [Streptomyces sp. Li-HN-5-11]|uniref:hypothetical protein n=1 Tax=Streptomyces sp. Li-HN-5-11 TaxID=3075432 RepID=UPI0028A81D22|nr:hypothetical protein [Streptomyces sp. Li-HN-5-11]WNM30022.1 hypothetical protein RKE30_06205 [Streptomyces sp. Li-HN-5-11]